MSMPNFVAQTLQQRILSGVYAPGEVLPGQRELAGQLGVSRGALREAVSVLMTLGFLRSVPGKGTFVAHRGEQRTGLASRSAEQTMQLRYIIEPCAAALAARTTGSGAASQFHEMQARFNAAAQRPDRCGQQRPRVPSGDRRVFRQRHPGGNLPFIRGPHWQEPALSAR